MSNSVRRALTVAGCIVAIAAGAWLISWFEAITKTDPFAAYRSQQGDQRIGIVLEDAQMRHYSAAKLIAEATIGRVEVQNDRQRFELFDIGNGVYRYDDGEFRFDAPEARYDAITKTMQASEGAHVFGKDFNLKTPMFVYDQAKEVLTAPGEISGDLFDGKVSGKNLTLDVPKREFEIGPIQWTGMVKAPLQDAGVQDPNAKATKWSVTGDKVKRMAGKDVFTNASATDGEILVKAPTIERDVKTDVITATGKVYYFSAKSNMVCDKAVIYRKEKRAVLTGNVTMLVKPQDKEVLDFDEVPPFRPTVPDEVAASRPEPPQTPEAEQQKDLDDEVRSADTRRKYPIVVRSDKIEYWYGKGSRRGIITGNPQARQELAAGRWRQLWTHEALYDGEKERLKLISEQGKQQVRMKTSLGDDLYAAIVELSTKENDEEYEAENVKGDLYPDEDEVEREKQGTGGGTTGGGG